MFDNRGVGHSDSPKGAYKTSEMAKDIVELLQEVGWIKEGEEGVEANLNVVGVSMGGMIALELVSLVSLVSDLSPFYRECLKLISTHLDDNVGSLDPSAYSYPPSHIDQIRLFDTSRHPFLRFVTNVWTSHDRNGEITRRSNGSCCRDLVPEGMARWSSWGSGWGVEREEKEGNGRSCTFDRFCYLLRSRLIASRLG